MQPLTLICFTSAADRFDTESLRDLEAEAHGCGFKYITLRVQMCPQKDQMVCPEHVAKVLEQMCIWQVWFGGYGSTPLTRCLVNMCITEEGFEWEDKTPRPSIGHEMIEWQKRCLGYKPYARQCLLENLLG